MVIVLIIGGSWGFGCVGVLVLVKKGIDVVIMYNINEVVVDEVVKEI